MKANLVKFDEDGTQCRRDIEYLRKHPECGIPFIQDKPFEPIKPTIPSFQQRVRDFDIKRLNEQIKQAPDVPIAPTVPTGPVSVKEPQDNFYSPSVLPQDATNRYLDGRRILTENYGERTDEQIATRIHNQFTKSGYGSVPVIKERPVVDIELSQINRRGLTDEELIDLQIKEQPRAIGEIEMEDFGAGVGIPNEAPPPVIRQNRTDEELIDLQIRTQARKTTLPKPRRPLAEIEGTELVVLDPDVEEQVVTQQAGRFVRKGRPQISKREAEQIADFFIQKNISRERTMEILKEYNLYDEEFELELEKIPDPKERAMIRRMRAQRLMTPERNTNLLPQRQPSVEFSEDTNLLPRGAEIELTELQQTRLPTLRQLEISGDIELPELISKPLPPITEEVTGFRPSDLQAPKPLDFEPTGIDYTEGFNLERPTLTYAQRVRAGTLSEEAGVGGVGAVGGVLIGFGVGKLMQDAGVQNPFAIGAGAGAAGGAGARILTMAGTRALTRSAATVATESLAYAAIRSGTSILRGAAEGGIIGLIAAPLDVLLNNFLYSKIHSHTTANVLSSSIVGGGTTALSTLGLAALGAAPETLGLSLVVGGIAAAVGTLFGLGTGLAQDAEQRRQEKKLEKQRQDLIASTEARIKLIKSLPDNDYDYQKAIGKFDDVFSLGLGNETWENFNTSGNRLFIENPEDLKPTVSTDTVKDQETQDKLNNLFSQYVTHQLINRVCTGEGTDCTEIRQRDHGELTEEEIKYLDEKTKNVWKSQADLQVEMSYQELSYTRQRISTAQEVLLNSWNEQGGIWEDLDNYYIDTASLDPTFRTRYELALKLDAQQQVVDAYQTNQTKLDKLPRNIRKMANLDPDFDDLIHKYYNTIETTASQLQITPKQVIELQGLADDTDQQRKRYEQMQFDVIKQDPRVVTQAKELAQEEDLVRAHEFYDIDEAYMLSDPTNITNWQPSDAQILQANNVGMTLTEYVNYMHELAKGDQGDFTNLPQYTQEQINKFTTDDVEHFQRELKMSGHDGLYTWDSQNRTWVLHDEVANSVIASQAFLDRYTPRALLKARQEYADMVHGLNEKNQHEVDNYNGRIMRELSSYGKHYDSLVAHINDERLYQGRSDLLFYDVGKIYNQNKIEFNPLSTESKSQVTDVISRAAVNRNLQQQTQTQTETTQTQATIVQGISGSDTPLPTDLTNLE